MANPFTGPLYLLQGLKLIFHTGIRRIAFVPLLINIFIFTILITVAYLEFSNLVEWLLSFLPGWLDWLRFLLWPFFAIAVFLLLYFCFTLLANLVAAPFLGPLSAAIEKHITQEDINLQSESKPIVREAVIAITEELRKLIYFLLRAIPLGILFLIPGVNIFAPFIWIVFSAWMLSLEYLDIPMGNHEIPFRSQHERIREKRWLSMSFGGAVMVALLIPVLNFLVLPSAVAGATILYCKNLQKE